jgi:hypothetical protein
MNAERQRQHEDKKMETLFTGRVYDHYGETVQEYTGINADALEQKILEDYAGDYDVSGYAVIIDDVQVQEIIVESFR